MKFAPFAVVFVVLAVGTLIEGKYSERWGKSDSVKLSQFTERLKLVPDKVGDWEGTDEPINEEEFEASHCDGCVSRTYRNREGQRVNVYLVSGIARHVTIHTPDWCYVGAGYEKLDDPQQYTIKDVQGVEPQPEFLTAVFQKDEPLRTHRIRIFWGFSDDGAWRGPRMPKPAYAGRPALYKLYLITDLEETNQEIERNPTLEFVRAFLPQVNRVLFPSKGESDAAAAG